MKRIARNLLRVTSVPKCGYATIEEKERSFEIFNNLRIKFGFSVTEKCNLNCFFCHNEGMPNPRSPHTAREELECYKSDNRLPIEDLLQMVNDYTELGGRAMRITGGEPLLLPEFFEFVDGIEKRDTLIYLNSNLVLAERLIEHDFMPKIDFINTSIHTTDPEKYAEQLGGDPNWTEDLFDNTKKLIEKGYVVNINFSLGDYNEDDFPLILGFCRENGVRLRVIPVVRSDMEGGENMGYISAEKIREIVEGEGGELMEDISKPGEQITMFRNVYKMPMPGEGNEEKYSITNIIDLKAGRLAVEKCFSCPSKPFCGEGIRCFRAGVDGYIRKCLLNDDMITKIEKGKKCYKDFILDEIHDLVGGLPDDIVSGDIDDFINAGVPM